ncbi:hypothetical protein OF83DRAFT_324204 [Amylostereum chailletii]|nr:hypothetical protein OF83DRAFT_324204 [Amylostereum chailletii]
MLDAFLSSLPMITQAKCPGRQCLSSRIGQNGGAATSMEAPTKDELARFNFQWIRSSTYNAWLEPPDLRFHVPHLRRICSRPSCTSPSSKSMHRKKDFHLTTVFPSFPSVRDSTTRSGSLIAQRLQASPLTRRRRRPSRINLLNLIFPSVNRFIHRKI